MDLTVYSRLRAVTLDAGHAVALLGLGRKPLSYEGLLQQFERTVDALNAIGIGRGDKVAIVLPNGPEAAACYLSVACGATAAVLNPGATAAELEASLSELQPKAIVVEDGNRSPWIAGAQSKGIPILRLVSNPQDPAGIFRLQGGTRGRANRPGFAEPDDVALIVETSGSTARPKKAPLTQRNICWGAMNNVTQFGLTAQDRCLCITGMFYTQAILVSVLSSLVVGASAACTPGYDPDRFFEWLDEFRPTWYSAPTAMHRSILARAALHREIVSRSRLRLIRSTSAAAGADFIQKMETLFRAPLLDTYGLSETSSTIAGHRLPPAVRKTGSVGTPIGCEIAILDASGAKLPAGQVGEVVVRGPNVISAYQGDPEINRQSFINGWLRTGDLGRFDEDGFLFLTGRIKEIINRGGEKILPAEIDEVLKSHPAVAEAVAFALPDERLDEEVAAAILLHEGQAGSKQLETELRDFCAARLATSKVPRRIVFVTELPKTATGKLLRIGLAQKLGITAPESKPALPATTIPVARASWQEGSSAPGIVEMLLLHIWEEALGRRPIGIHDDFFDLGGDSLLGARLLANVEQTFGKKLGLNTLFEVPTVARMAARLSESPSRGYTFEASKIITVRSAGSLPPLFILGLHPLFRPLLLNLPQNLPVYGLSFPDVASLAVPFRMEDIGARQVQALRKFQPEGPYALMGWCADGVLAYEMAQQLRAQGQEVSLVMLVDAFNPARWKYESRWAWRRDRLRFHLRNLWKRESARYYLRDRFQTLVKRSRQRYWRLLYRLHLRADRRIAAPTREYEQILTLSVSQYEPLPYNGPVMVVRAQERPPGTHADAAHGWRTLVKDLHIADVPGDHRDMFIAPNVGVMASTLSNALSAAGPAPKDRVPRMLPASETAIRASRTVGVD